MPKSVLHAFNVCTSTQLILEHGSKNKNVHAIEFETRYVSRQLLEGFPAMFVSLYVPC